MISLLHQQMEEYKKGNFSRQVEGMEDLPPPDPNNLGKLPNTRRYTYHPPRVYQRPVGHTVGMGEGSLNHPEVAAARHDTEDEDDEDDEGEDEEDIQYDRIDEHAATTACRNPEEEEEEEDDDDIDEEEDEMVSDEEMEDNDSVIEDNIPDRAALPPPE